MNVNEANIKRHAKRILNALKRLEPLATGEGDDTALVFDPETGVGYSVREQLWDIEDAIQEILEEIGTAHTDLNQSHKSLIQKRITKSSEHLLKSGYYNTDEHPEGGGTCDYCQTEIAPGDGYEKDFQSTRDTAVQKLYKALGGNDKYSYQVQTEGDLERWLRQADEEIDEDYVNDMINEVIDTAFKDKDGCMCHDCLEASLMSAAEEWVENNW